MKFLISTVLIFISVHFKLEAQSIQGRWMQIRIPNEISYPAINIIEIQEDNIIAYDFDKMYSKGNLRVEKDKFIIADSIEIGFRFLGENVFEQFAKSQTSEKYPSYRFVRLLPTKDENNLADDIQTKTYRINFPSKDVLFKMGEKLNVDNAFIVDNPSIAGDFVTIKKFEKTYFMCIFSLKQFVYAFPIKEINTHGFIIYGVPLIDNDVVVTEL